MAYCVVSYLDKLKIIRIKNITSGYKPCIPFSTPASYYKTLVFPKKFETRPCIAKNKRSPGQTSLIIRKHAQQLNVANISISPKVKILHSCLKFHIISVYRSPSLICGFLRAAALNIVSAATLTENVVSNNE
jgi:hypothetical protein